MNVLHLLYHPIFGGPHNQVLRLSGPLAARGWNTQAVVTDEPGNGGPRLQQAGVPVQRLHLRRLRATVNPWTHTRFLGGLPAEISRLRSIIRRHSTDVVVVYGLTSPHAAVAARAERVPIVWQIIDTRSPMILRRTLMPVVKHFADVIMSTGTETARQHPGAMALGTRLVPFIPPVDTREFRPDDERRAAARIELGVPTGGVLVATVGNINPQKGHEHLLQAASLMQKDVPAAKWRILGADTPTQLKYKHRLQRAAEMAGLAKDETLAFVDPGSRVAELLPGLDVFVLTSVPRSEGVPTVILEAMACGIPVVATDVGGVREVVEDGRTGFVVPPGDVVKIARAVAELVRDPDARIRMGSAGRRRALAEYDMEVCADAHARAFELALVHHRGQRVT